jgi:hypothetical protein
MPFKGVCLDGYEQMAVEFEDKSSFVDWQLSMMAIKAEAHCIVLACDHRQANLTMEDVRAIRNWIRRVNEMVQASTPVLPTILTARDTFADTIEDG